MPLKYSRVNLERGSGAGTVNRDKRMLSGYAVITRGEALGHGAWVDAEMLNQVIAAGNAAPDGIKMRFTHPGLCADGLGTYLGRAVNFRLDGDIVRADALFAECASQSPKGDLAGYVMKLAEDDPKAFATSIVFERDVAAENAYMLANGGTIVEGPDGEQCIIGFKSPDASNDANWPHFRVASMTGSDVVDEPAANPGGMFSRGGEMADRADSALKFLCGLSKIAPSDAFGSLDPDRAKTFFTSFLQRHGLSLSVARPKAVANKEETSMPMSAEEKAAAEKEFRAGETARVASLKATFPNHPDFVVNQIEAGASLSDAKIAFKDVELAEAKAHSAKLEARLAAAPVVTPQKTGAVPAAFGAPVEGKGSEGKGFMQLAREYASEKRISLGDAIKACTKLHAEEHAAFVEEQRSFKPRKIERVPTK